jgi:phosphatidylserine decarboxylase
MFARGSLPAISLSVALAGGSAVASILISGYLWVLSILLIVMSTFFAWFFRDPERKTGKGIVAPADGLILNVRDLQDRVLISTFMNLYDVHVNRAPISGTVVEIEKKRGSYLPAYDKRADKNNRVTYLIRSGIGDVEVVQICGVFARRIVSYVEKGAKVVKGERIGMIRFGSRVDMILPKHTPRGDMITIVIRPGWHVNAGVTTVARVTRKKRNTLKGD